MNLELAQKVFDEYVNNFPMENYDIHYKYIHSCRVKEIATVIAHRLHLSEEDISLATLIGLLHDIGRFKQIEMFGSYDDANIDHADLGVQVLFEEGLIEKFGIDKKYYELISFCIQNHNKLNVEKTDDERIRMHAKIIRDADKIDIFRAFAIYHDYKLLECNEDITRKVKETFYKKELVNYQDRKNTNDNIISTLSYIFNMEYEVSLDIIKEEKIIESLYKDIKKKELFKEYFEYMKKYLEKEIVGC